MSKITWVKYERNVDPCRKTNRSKMVRPVVKLYDVLIGTKKRMIRITWVDNGTNVESSGKANR